MTNAREEFKNAVEGQHVHCATISHGYSYGDEDDYVPTYNLPVGYTEQEYEDFLKSLDFEYDSGYGGQELFGTIWFLDGTWSDRGEYDGSEWWEHHEVPEIPAKLLRE